MNANYNVSTQGAIVGKKRKQRNCLECFADLTGQPSRRVRCKDPCAKAHREQYRQKYMREYMREYWAKRGRKSVKNCKVCNAKLPYKKCRYGRPPVTCSDICKKIRDRELNLKYHYENREERLEKYRTRRLYLLVALFVEQEGICTYCNKPIEDLEKVHIDHIIPQRAGGSDERDNINLLHPRCNFRKRSREDALIHRRVRE